MADDSNEVPDDENDAPAPLVNQTADSADPADLPESVKLILAKERKAARDAEKARKAAEARAKQYEDRDKTEAQKLEERATAAEGRIGPLEQENTRLRVALEKGLPVDLIDRLRGNTAEELATDADVLLARFSAGQRQVDVGLGPRSSPPPNDMNSLIRQQVAARRGS